MVITGASWNAHRHNGNVGRVMADIERASEVLSRMAGKLALDTGQSVVIIIGNDEGSLMGACVAELELAAMAAQLRLIADDLAEQAAVGMN